MAERPTPLLTAALATFEVSLFVLLAVFAGHASGVLSDLLAGLNTGVGVVVFAYLWALVWLATRWVLSRVSLDDGPVRTVAGHALVAGAALGACFVLGPAVVAGTPAVVLTPLEPLSLALIGLFGMVGGIVVGGVVGLAFGLLDLAFYRGAGRVLPAATLRSDQEITEPDRDATEPDRL